MELIFLLWLYNEFITDTLGDKAEVKIFGRLDFNL